jgi:wyosine [tRNA(Phe)-imidazoG37] synthetase (radical SAM superfamily)
MTNACGVDSDGIDKHLVDWNKSEHKFEAACRFAKTVGVTNILLTGRGEPTLYPEEIEEYLYRMQAYQFPFVELQTNGISIANGELPHRSLKWWQEHGLTHIAVSIAHWDNSINNKIYGANPAVCLPDLFDTLDSQGFSMRACLTLCKGFVDSVADFKKVVELCNSHGVRQLRVASLARPTKSSSHAVANWVDQHIPEHVLDIADHVIDEGHYLRTLPHGAPIFDYNGLSVCLADCFPKQNRVGNGLQPIFWPDGSLTYSWEWKGAVLM